MTSADLRFQPKVYAVLEERYDIRHKKDKKVLYYVSAEFK